MAWGTAWAGLKANFTLPSLMITAVYIIFIAIAIEILSWWAGRLIEKWVTPYIAIDVGRPAGWRVRRRTTLRHAPKWLTKAALYTIGVILIANVFGVPVLTLSIAVGAVVLVMGAGIAPISRDVVQGYILLAEDALAPGDLVEINGHIGTVEKMTLRSTWLKAHNGRLHIIANRAITSAAINKRAEEAPPPDFPEVRSATKPQSTKTQPAKTRNAR